MPVVEGNNGGPAVQQFREQQNAYARAQEENRRQAELQEEVSSSSCYLLPGLSSPRRN